MANAIEIEPNTGLKKFNTRAAKSSDKIQGKGYSVVEDESLKSLPEEPAGAKFSAEEQEKYRAFKEARAGAADYIGLEGEFADYLTDVYSDDPVHRDALDDQCEILVVGAGFAGLLLWYKLKQAGFNDVRFCEKGGDVGGTWYWNRYPGIACDVEAYSYLPLLEEMGYIPSMKFAGGFEIMEYCQSMATKFGFYDRCLFHTTVENTEWDEESGLWTVRTDRGDAMKARYVVLANGILTTPKLARIEGMEKFEGDAFHTSRWRYDVDLTGKRVGIIGTGASAGSAGTREDCWRALRVSEDTFLNRRKRPARNHGRRKGGLARRAGMGYGSPQTIYKDLRGSDCAPVLMMIICRARCRTSRCVSNTIAS